MNSAGLKAEYADGVSSLNETLRQHMSFCLYHNFDQILDSDLITVSCCSCNKALRLTYDKITTMYCDDCHDTEFNDDDITKHIANLKQRLSDLQYKLMTF
jgi:hypothetical protein